jgi:hypothetical protein
MASSFERVQVCRYRAPRRRGFARPALRSRGAGRGIRNLESADVGTPPLSIAFASSRNAAVTGAEAARPVWIADLRREAFWA